MVERPALKRAPRQIHEIDAHLLEFHAEVAAVGGGSAFVLELDGVDLDADDEAGVGNAAVDLVDDLEDDAGAVGEAGATVGVGAVVGGGGDELCEEVAVGAVDLESG